LDVSVKDALDMASWYAWQCQSFAYSPLRGYGFTAVWPEDTNGDGNYETGYWQLGYNGILEVYGNSNIHLKNFQPPDYVTPPSINGPTWGDNNTYYQFSACSIDDYGHNVRYRFDWGDGSYTETNTWYANGATEVASHSWSSDGTYAVRVQACCPYTGWTSWSSPIYVSIGVHHWITINAYDAYLGEGWPLAPNVYVDGNFVGTAPVSVYVTRADHTITLDYTTSDPYWGPPVDAHVVSISCMGWYWIGDPTYVYVGAYSDSTVNALYTQWW
jgi:hypothetical protein